jgi:hypothetical protein
MAYNRTAKTGIGTARRMTLAKASSAMALATGLMLGASGPAHAQAFEGNPTVVSGNVNITRGTNTDNIRVDSNQAVINWTTNDIAIGGGVINFLPNGRTAFFRNNPTAQNQFTVLNRIIPNDPSRAIAMNGTIISQLQTGAGLVSGGNVWFYSPGGIVVGSTGVIDVGGLLLTSLDPVRDASGNFINAAGSFTLGPAASGTSFVQVDAGAQILATPENSYVALVSPSVTQRGTINVNGSAALVAAEAVRMTFNTGGLFDIEVTQGTNGIAPTGLAIDHSGTTGGPASSGAGDNHRIYMVAIPKNNAVTILFRNNNQLGFDVAGAANTDGNAIILSAGYNVFGDTVDRTPVNPLQNTNISFAPIAGATFNVTSKFTAESFEQVNLGASSGGTLNFASDVNIYGRRAAVLVASGTGVVSIAGNYTASTSVTGASSGQNGTAGFATTLAAENGGRITIGGDASLFAIGTGADSAAGGPAGNGRGGQILVRSSNNSTLNIGRNLVLNADGIAGNTGPGGTGAATGTGGTITIESGVAGSGASNSILAVGGNLLASANGSGSSNFGAGNGGAAFGGTVRVGAGGTGTTSGNTLSIIGTATLNADAFGGNSVSGIGGAGRGGVATFGSGTGGSASVSGNLLLTAFGIGGQTTSATGTGGLGTGGTTQFGVFSAGGITTAGGDVLLQSIANGGFAGIAGGTGGNAQGGTAQIFINGAGGSITVAGLSTVESLAVGGSGTIGGNGTGGTSLVNTNSTGTMTLNNGVNIGAGGISGSAVTTGSGRSGNGTGGLAQMVALAGGVINVTGTVDINANGVAFNSETNGIDGGDGRGGNASISQNTGGRITITGNAVVKAIGIGDVNSGGGDGIAGNGFGGDARIAVNDLNITITGNASVDASGFGGANFGGLRGGTGTGGLANLGAGAGTLSIGGNGEARADAIGGSSSGPGSGGDGVGGQALIGSIAGGIIQIAGTANATAQGFGGNGSGTGNVGGLGDGGTAQMFADNTGRVTVGSVTTMSAGGFGGSVAAGASSGAALGGLVSLLSQGNGQITLNSDVFLSGQALSGNVDDGAGNAAAATAGTVNVFALGAGGGITVNGSLFADAIAGVGSAVTGTIADALGGTVELAAGPGTINITGPVSLDATAFGGNSNVSGNGGNAAGGRTAVVISSNGNGTINLGSTLTMASNAFGGLAHTGNGGNATGGLSEEGSIGVAGSFTFGGAVSMSANGNGGESVIAGNGGSGTGGTSRFGSNNTQMTGRDLFIAADGRGGNGALGGRGGDATGGLATLVAGAGTVVGLLDFDNAFLSASAFGGTGGAGATGATGGAGGAGGNATGGRTNVIGTARNGQLDILNLQVTMNGFGGAGGAGGVGTAGAGGNGGAGGIGTGGSAQIGTVSATITTGPNPTPTGFMTMADAVIEANGFGGMGGDGGVGTTTNGNGGNGGLGDGGDIFFATRGSLVQVNALTMLANANGGAGGSGAVRGNGGNAISGVIGVESTEQFQAPTNRGRLVAGDITAIARGTGGTGAVNGRTFYETGSFFRAVNGDVTANSIVYNIGNAGDAPEPTGIVEDFVRVTDATVNAGSSFTFITPGQLSALVSNGTLSAAAVGLVAGTFVADTVVTAPTNIGAINTGALALQSSGNLIVTANINATQNIAISVPGTVNLRNISSGGVIGISGSSLTLGNLGSGNHINLTSTTGAITAGNMTAANFIAMTAANGLTIGLATANTGFIDLLVLSGNMTVGNLRAGTFIDLETRAGNIVIGDTQSGTETDIEAVGTLQFGNGNSGSSFSAAATGNLTGGNVAALGTASDTTFSVGLRSDGGNITVGNLSGPRNVGMLAAGTMTSGSLTSGENVVLLGTGNIQINGPVTGATGANRHFYVGNASMASLFGTNFDPAPLFGVTPVRTTGSLTVTGPILAGNVLAGVGTALNVNGGITATGGRIGITANSVTAQNISSTLATVINATNGNLQLGNIFASGTPTAGGVSLTASGTITAGTISTGTTPGLAVSVDGGGAVSIGGITATGAANLRSRAGSFTSTGAITAASVGLSGIGVALTNVTSTAGQILIGAFTGNLTFGTLTSSTNTQFSAGGSVTGGNITAGSWIGTTVGGNMTLGNLRTTGAGTSPNGFSIGLGANGAITTGTIDSFGLLGIGSDDGQGNLGNAASITTGAITAGGSAFLRSTQGLTTGAITSTNEIRVRGGTVTTGALQATNAILAAAMTGNLTTGNVTTGTSALLLASQSVNTGAISTGTSGTTLISNSSAISATGLISTIDLNALLAATPVRVAGSVSIGAPVTTGTLLSASTGGFSASAAITAGTRISLDVGGTAVFGGLAVAPTISISSGDIAFSQAGGLGNANTGTITLTANRSGAVIIGGTTSDSQSQQGSYTLDGSEISRIRAQNIVINAPNVSSTGTGVEIRALTMNGSAAASGVNLNGGEGSLTINTSGTIRVNGNAIFNSMASGNRVALNAGRVEINADTGGIFLNGSSPGGVLTISANNIHIASASLLDQLASNVNFTGRDTALSLPIATSRPDGVIQASQLQFRVGSTLLIQNTGTSLLNAGFFGRVGTVQITPRSSQSTSSLIDMVIYGQLLDTGDIVRNGTSVRDLIFPRSTSTSTTQDSPTTVSGFTANSSVNGCLLSAISCGGGGVTEMGPTAVVHAGPPPPRPAEERQAEREQEEAEAAAEEAARGEAAPRRPIMPPVTIVNTRRLGVEPIIDEPVTSGGNPNLQLDQPLPDTGGQP